MNSKEFQNTLKCTKRGASRYKDVYIFKQKFVINMVRTI
jgi:hypothetical protein